MQIVKRIAPAALLLLAALSLLALASMSSPLYPTNIWGDANCLLTVGRAMKAGRVLYRDIYEQKGPTLYLAHELAAWVSDRSFLGVYLVEALCLTGFLLAARRLLLRRSPAASAASILCAALILGSRAFCRGDSAEEFCLPFAMTALALTDGVWRAHGVPLPPRRLLALGLLAGIVASVKFTLLGVFLGLCMCEGLFALKAGGPVRALKSAGIFLLGMALPILLWIAYFAAHGALDDAYHAYLYNNLFLYAGKGRVTLLQAKAFLRGNFLWVLPSLCGIAAFLFDRRETAAARAACALSFVVQLLAVLLPGRVWAYSLLAVAPYALYGTRFVAEVLHRRLPRACLPLAIVLSLAICFASPNAFLRGVPYEQTAQHRLAAQIPPGSSVLQASFLDDGLYLATGTIPEEKYFVLLNVELPAMREALDGALEARRPDYVLMSFRTLPERFQGYELVASDAGYLDDNRLGKWFSLYKRSP